MIQDFLSRETPDEFSVDLCIIGAGAAGITIAAEFLKTSTRVLLIESGSFALDGPTQALYDVENSGISRSPMITQRLRMFGGTTNHWDGRCAMLDPIDFESRPWVPNSGWPISHAAVAAFYPRAHDVCDLPSTLQNEEAARTIGLPAMPSRATSIAFQTWQQSPPTRFGTKYRAPLENAGNVSVLLNANVTRIVLSADRARVSHVELTTLDGRRGRASAPRFVLACGGIENPRILLASLRQQLRPESTDIIGRYFMEHLRTKYTAAPVGDDYLFRTLLHEYRTPKGRFLGGLRIPEFVQRQLKIGNVGVMSYTEGGENSPTNSAVRIASQLSKGKVPENLGTDVLSVLSDINSILVNVRRRFLLPGGDSIEKALVAVVVESEQAPNPDSRITLASETDALGMPKANVHWRLSESDLLTTRSAVKTFAEQLAAYFNVRIRIPEWLSSPLGDWEVQYRDVAHHMGTTRMSSDPSQGVVDTNCAMHAVPNLFIAGSSVFPTGGHVNPTLTIVALALRLADHLKQSTSRVS